MQLVSQQIEGAAQRLAPVLAPARMAARVAAAVATPAFDAVSAAPGRILADLRLHARRMRREVLTVVRQLGELLPFQRTEGVGEPHLPEAVMVPERLTVRCQVGQARDVARYGGV